MRFFAVDRAGNVSENFYATYDLRNAQPKIPVLTAEPGDWSTTLTWEATGTEDLHAYQLFRVEGETENLLRTFGPTHEFTFTEENLRPDRHYTYFVQAIDRFGNTSLSERVSVTPIDNDPIPPVANAGFNFNIPVGVEAAFDGGSSTDNDIIASYHWDFGDGHTADTVQAIHIFETIGKHEVALTVTDRSGNVDTSTITINAMSPLGLGTLRVRVLDRNTGIPLAGATVHADLPEGAAILHTNGLGIAEITTIPVLTAEPGDWSTTLTWEATGTENLHVYQLFRGVATKCWYMT